MLIMNILQHCDLQNIDKDLRPLTVADFYAFDETNDKTYTYAAAASAPVQENLD